MPEPPAPMPTAPSILLTGFEPFGGEAINPSWEAVRALDGCVIADHRVVARRLPVSFGGAAAALRAALDAVQPQLVLAVGQAGGRAALSLERIAINLVDARIPDNDGCQPIDCPVIPGAAPACFTTLPVKAMRVAIEAAGIPAELSHSAGCYVCNAVFFVLMQSLGSRAGVRGGFMHVPWLPEQALRHPGQPSLELPCMIEGLRVALAAAASHGTDLAEPGGFTH
jgi:pyroglutamyl-peptidase